MPKATRETYGAKETAKRRDEALKRALNTPPKPLKQVQRTPKKGKAASRKREE